MPDDKLAKPISFGPRKFGLAAQRAEAVKALEGIDPLTCKNRLGILFDDSGSMGGQPIEDAKSAIRNFTVSCNAMETSLAIFPMNAAPKDLTNNYDLINLFVGTIRAIGGTPLYTGLISLLDAPITRGVLFSDGDPTDEYNNYNYVAPDRQLEVGQQSNKDKAIAKAKEKKIAIDTVYIGSVGTKGYATMQWIAEQTGGIFIHFQDSKSLSSGLKYLSPALRGLLADPNMKDKVQKGEL